MRFQSCVGDVNENNLSYKMLFTNDLLRNNNHLKSMTKSSQLNTVIKAILIM